MAETLGDDVDRNARLEQQCWVRVSQPVEVEGWCPRRGHEAVVSVRDVVGRDGLAVLGREHVAGVHSRAGTLLP